MDVPSDAFVMTWLQRYSRVAQVASTLPLEQAGRLSHRAAALAASLVGPPSAIGASSFGHPSAWTECGPVKQSFT